MKTVEFTISNTLKDLGISAGLLGYGYLKEAISLTMDDKSIVHAITKELYPRIAKKFGTTSSRVERAIRHAIERSWDMHISDARVAIFGCSISPASGKPTNGQFIATVADHLLMVVGVA